MFIRTALILATLVGLPSLEGHAQQSPHPEAEEALQRIVFEQNFGDDLELDSRESVTMLENPKVPGLNGLLFLRWKGTDPATEIVASVQWFEKGSDLIRFYREEKARVRGGLLPVGDTVIWKTSENSYLWTDGEHFVVGLGGRPAPPREMLEAWLALIESNPPDLARVPAAPP